MISHCFNRLSIKVSASSFWHIHLPLGILSDGIHLAKGGLPALHSFIICNAIGAILVEGDKNISKN